MKLGEIASKLGCKLEGDATAARAGVLLEQLSVAEPEPGTVLPDPGELAATALRTIRLPQVAAFASGMVPEMAIWSLCEGEFLAGRADALVLEGSAVDAVFDWKSNVNPTKQERAAYLNQLTAYARAAGARRGALVYMSLGEVDWFEFLIPLPDTSPASPTNPQGRMD